MNANAFWLGYDIEIKIFKVKYLTHYISRKHCLIAARQNTNIVIERKECIPPGGTGETKKVLSSEIKCILLHPGTLFTNRA